MVVVGGGGIIEVQSTSPLRSANEAQQSHLVAQTGNVFNVRH